MQEDRIWTFSGERDGARPDSSEADMIVSECNGGIVVQVNFSINEKEVPEALRGFYHMKVALKPMEARALAAAIKGKLGWSAEEEKRLIRKGVSVLVVLAVAVGFGVAAGMAVSALP